MEFEARIVQPGRGVTQRRVEALDRLAAQKRLAAEGLIVLSVQPVVTRRIRVGKGNDRERLPLVLTAQELLSLLRAGLNVVEALEALSQKEGGTGRTTLGAILAELRQGRTLSQALELFPTVFPPIFVATVRASERTGDLANSLERFINYQTQMDVVKKRIVSASIYPVILLSVGALVTLFLLGYVVPKFSTIYADGGRNLPFASRLLLQWGSLVEGHALEVGAAGISAIIAAIVILFQSRSAILAAAWNIPSIGQRLLVYELARFYRTLGMLLRGGIPIVVALDMAAGLLNPALRPRLEAARGLIRNGKGIAEAMIANGLTTNVAASMLKVGERTGEMADMMDRIAAFCDEEIARWVDWVTRLIEPLLMTVMGAVIGLIVVLMYLPIFELAGGVE